MTMAKHETTTKTLNKIVRKWNQIDPKVIVGAVSSVTVGTVVSAGAALGWNIPVWAASIVVIVVYFVGSYLTSTTIPVADDSGLSAQQAAIAGRASVAGDALSDDDLRAAAVAAFQAGEIALDDDGNVIDTSHPLVATSDEPPAQNTLAP